MLWSLEKNRRLVCPSKNIKVGKWVKDEMEKSLSCHNVNLTKNFATEDQIIIIISYKLYEWPRNVCLIL